MQEGPCLHSRPLPIYNTCLFGVATVNLNPYNKRSFSWHGKRTTATPNKKRRCISVTSDFAGLIRCICQRKTLDWITAIYFCNCRKSWSTRLPRPQFTNPEICCENLTAISFPFPFREFHRFHVSHKVHRFKHGFTKGGYRNLMW